MQVYNSCNWPSICMMTDHCQTLRQISSCSGATFACGKEALYNRCHDRQVRTLKPHSFVLTHDVLQYLTTKVRLLQQHYIKQSMVPSWLGPRW